jgi:hypothetical protein
MKNRIDSLYIGILAVGELLIRSWLFCTTLKSACSLQPVYLADKTGKKSTFA